MHLVLVHHGPHYPAYIGDCLRQIRRCNNADGGLQVHLLLDDAVHAQAGASALVDGASTVVSTATFPRGELHERFERASRLNRDFRDGFWHFCTKRFLTLLDYARHAGLSDDIFHMEYDNLLCANLHPILQALRGHDDFARAAAVFDCEHECVPSFMYFRDADSLEHVAKFMLDESHRSANDMTLLADYRRRYPAHIGCLPVATPAHAGAHGLLSHEYLYKHADRFGCLFDGRALGQYLGGVDPRNIPGDTTGFINESCLVRAPDVDFKFDADAGRATACGLPVVNLHIHSKDLRRWSPRTSPAP